MAKNSIQVGDIPAEAVENGGNLNESTPRDQRSINKRDALVTGPQLDPNHDNCYLPGSYETVTTRVLESGVTHVTKQIRTDR